MNVVLFLLGMVVFGFCAGVVIGRRFVWLLLTAVFIPPLTYWIARGGLPSTGFANSEDLVIFILTSLAWCAVFYETPFILGLILGMWSRPRILNGATNRVASK